jgi:hypothetical protein
MELGVYKSPPIEDDSEIYERIALYDFEEDEWNRTSCGSIVAKASPNPSPEEVKLRFEFEQRRTIVRTPERMIADGKEISIAEPSMSVEEGHEYREELGGPFPTKAELQYRRNQGVKVFADDFEITEDVLNFYDERGIEVVRESEFEDINLSEAFEFEFYMP